MSHPDDAPDEFDDERPERSSSSSRAPRRGRSSRQPLQLAILAAVVVVLAAGALAWRAHHRRQVVAQGLTRAEALLRLDTAAGYREAERLLEPLVELDPIAPAASRAFALAMLALDYRDEDAARRAEALLVAPGRAEKVPRHAELAQGALALARREAGTALAHATRTGDVGAAAVLQARVAMLAGKLDVARDPLDRAVAADPALPAAQALRGDVLRRTGHAGQAREAYAAALASSPTHARAAFGLAKLALAGGVSADEAKDALRRVLDDAAGTPSTERARAAYHLAALEARAGRAVESAAALDRAGADAGARAWLERAVAEQAQGTGYRVAADTPAALASASDDDPYVAPPRPPPSTAVSETFRMPDPPPHAARPKAAPAKPAPTKPAAKKPAKPAPKAAAKPGAKSAPKVAKAPKTAHADAKASRGAKAAAKPARAAAKPAGGKTSASAPSAIEAALAKVKKTAAPARARE